MQKTILKYFLIAVILTSCGESSKKKNGLDSTLFKYASVIRWTDFDAALRFLDPDIKDILPSSFELNKLKQYKVSSYTESPILPGTDGNSIIQQVKIEIYNIHNNRIKTISDTQTWKFNTSRNQWYLTTGLPKL